MKNRNRGELSVYLCAMTGVLLLLLVTIIQGVRIWESKARGAQAMSGAVYSLKGDYQPELFRRYHIFAIDATYYGRGEGTMEARAEEYLDTNLKSSAGLYTYEITNVEIHNKKYFMDDDLAGFYTQMKEDMRLRFPVITAQTVLGSYMQEEQDAEVSDEHISWQQAGETSDTTEIPEVLSEQELQDMGLDKIIREQGMEPEYGVTLEDLKKLKLAEQGWLKDPRQVLEAMGSNADILQIVIPENVNEVSKEAVVTGKLPSGGQASHLENIWKMEHLSDVTDMKNWIQGDFGRIPHIEVTESRELYGVGYALDCFQHAELKTMEEVQETGTAVPIEEEAQGAEENHVLTCELEYLIAGENSDYKNLETIAEQLCMIRMVPNAAYAFSDETMKKEALAAAVLILTPLGVPELAEPASYVLLGCWAYGESLLDVRRLLHGESVPLFKDETSWRLSLNGLSELADADYKEDGKAGEQGLCYENYLAVLLLMQTDSDIKYYRMLDVMQLNIQETEPNFQISHCIYEFQIQAEIREGRKSWYLKETGSYIKTADDR